MDIKPAKDPNACPRTRRELLAHLWSVGFSGLNCNVFKEGAYYAIQIGGRVGATHVRRLDSLTFTQWEKTVRDVQDGYVNLKG